MEKIMYLCSIANEPKSWAESKKLHEDYNKFFDTPTLAIEYAKKRIKTSLYMLTKCLCRTDGKDTWASKCLESKIIFIK